MKKELIIEKIESKKANSAWDKGVKEYALELLEDLDYLDEINSRENLLNGAKDWNEYSWGGCSLIYDGDIAQRLCTQSELKRTKNGERKPNANEEWLDTQARALYQASDLIIRVIENN